MLPEGGGISVPDHGNDSAAAAIIFRWAALCLMACFGSESGLIRPVPRAHLGYQHELLLHVHFWTVGLQWFS